MNNAQNMSIQLRGVKEKLKGYRVLDKDRALKKKLLRPGAKVVQQALAIAAPIGEKVHKRYPRKYFKGWRQPKGQGTVVATYHPGNLSRSVSIMNFTRAATLTVGAKVSKRGKGSGDFQGNRTDGYYLNWVEKKDPFWKQKVLSVENDALAANVESFKRWVKKVNK